MYLPLTRGHSPEKLHFIVFTLSNYEWRDGEWIVKKTSAKNWIFIFIFVKVFSKFFKNSVLTIHTIHLSILLINFMFVIVILCVDS